jgi:hypothetical protein
MVPIFDDGRSIAIQCARRRGCEPQECRQQFGVRQIVTDRPCRTRILNLDGYLAAIVDDRTVDLSDGGGRHRFVGELGEHLLGGPAQIGMQRLFGEAGVHGRRIDLQPGQCSLNGESAPLPMKLASTADNNWPAFISTPLECPSSSAYRSAVRSWKRSTAPASPVFSRRAATIAPPAARAVNPANGMVRRILPPGTGSFLPVIAPS